MPQKPSSCDEEEGRVSKSINRSHDLKYLKKKMEKNEDKSRSRVVYNNNIF